MSKTRSALLEGTLKQRRKRGQENIAIYIPVKAALQASLPSMELLVSGFGFHYAECRVLFSTKQEEQVGVVVSPSEAQAKVLELERKGWFCHSSFIPSSYKEKQRATDVEQEASGLTEPSCKREAKRAAYKASQKAYAMKAPALSWYICRTYTKRPTFVRTPLNEPSAAKEVSTDVLEAEDAAMAL